MPKFTKSKNTAPRTQPYRSTRAKMSASNSKSKNVKRASTAKETTTSWQAETAAGLDTPVFFWRPHEDWGLFGQWYDSPLKDPVSDVVFTCCEQYMMYYKAKAFGDDKIAQKVLETTDPREHKALGQKVSGFTDHEWDAVKFEIVVNANMLKYGGDCVAHGEDKFVYAPAGQIKGQESVKLRDVLLSTGDRELVEASPRDKIWGIGFSPQTAASQPRYKWGKNLLGKALMEVRQRLREEEAEPPAV